MINSKKQRDLESAATAEEETVFQGKVFTVVKEHLEFEDAPPLEWNIVSHAGAVGILPIDSNGNLILIQQWRRPIKQIIYEIPAGILEKGEKPLEAAQRELQEEIGYKAGQLHPLGGIHSAPGFCNEFIHIFLGTELVSSSLPGDEHEAIDLVTISLEDALSLIDEGIITDAKTIATLLRYDRSIRS